MAVQPAYIQSDGNNLYMLEVIGNTSNMMNMVKANPTRQQKIGHPLTQSSKKRLARTAAFGMWRVV
jgi:hypothetical protein